MSEQKKKNRVRLALKIVFPVAIALWLTFIFGNSLQSGEQSSAQSSTVVGFVQKLIGWVAPNSWAANATGEEYLRLHGFIRKLAHFTEFAVLGALLCGCYFAYTQSLRFFWLPIAGVFLFPCVDELLQKLSEGRASAFGDVLIDVSGGIVGFLAAWLLAWAIFKLCERKENKKEKEKVEEV